MNLEALNLQLESRILALESDKPIGLTSGIASFDYQFGRLKPNTIWIIGGYSGTGKSYFILNMIDGMIEDAKKNEDNKNYKAPTAVIYSTELSVEEYSWRHIHMRAGIYKTQAENYRNKEVNKQLKELKEAYIDERVDFPSLPDIVDNISTTQDIRKHIESLGTPPDIIFVDYVQELTVLKNKKILDLEADTMPYIKNELQKLAKDFNLCVIAISQVNNNMANTDFGTNRSNPFSYGKQLNQASTTSLVLTRRRMAGKTSPILEVHTVKSRDGDYNVVAFDIGGGFKLTPLEPEEAKKRISQFIEENDEPQKRRTT